VKGEREKQWRVVVYKYFMDKVDAGIDRDVTYRVFTFRQTSYKPVVPDPSIGFRSVFDNRAVGSGCEGGKNGWYVSVCV
jgi:hypothetical protein